MKWGTLSLYKKLALLAMKKIQQKATNLLSILRQAIGGSTHEVIEMGFMLEKVPSVHWLLGASRKYPDLDNHVVSHLVTFSLSLRQCQDSSVKYTCLSRCEFA